MTTPHPQGHQGPDGQPRTTECVRVVQLRGAVQLGTAVVQATRPPAGEIDLLVHVKRGVEAANAIRQLVCGGAFTIWLEPIARDENGAQHVDPEGT